MVGRSKRWGIVGPDVARSPGWLLILALLLLVTVACDSERRPGSGSATPSRSEEGDIVPRFLLGGWVLPEGEAPGVFVESLEAVIITSEADLRSLLEGVDLLRVSGDLNAINRTDFEETVVLAAYYLWRPLKGNPLSVQKVTVDGSEVRVSLELEADPQGRESPYLLAPLYVVGVDKAALPQGEPVRFQFLVNGELAATVMATLR